MDDEAIAQFTSITSASASQAAQYLSLTDGQLEQAIQLFFENPDLASSVAAPSVPAAQPQQNRAPRRQQRGYTEDEDGVVHLDSDDDDEPMMVEEDDDDDNDVVMIGTNTVRHAVDEDADAEMARRLQNEMYQSNSGMDADTVRAPIERVRQTLVGGEYDYDDADVSAMIQERIHRSRQGASRPGIFNQREVESSVWSNSEAQSSAPNLSFATGGASDRSTKANSLAEMFRPPHEIISRLPFDVARDQGKEEEKWLLVNIQDPSIFDCQVLNRDLWKNKEVQEIVKENFIFLQYSNDDPRGTSYVQYYFANQRHDQSAYPHIAIVDPRTGEQVKTWSGSPAPVPGDFLMALFEFLDRYSLNEDAKNPIAKRKPDRKDLAVDRMSEEEMFELAMKNSLANEAGGQAHEDPDDLTKSITLDKGKGKSSDSDTTPTNGQTTTSPFAAIPADKPHTEPTSDPASTTRIQFRHPAGRTIRKFSLQDPVQRIFEWLKAEPLPDRAGQEFDLVVPGGINLIESLNSTIEEAALKNATVMIEFTGDD